MSLPSSGGTWLPPHKRWYAFGLRAPAILFKRLESGHYSLFHPWFRLRMKWQRAQRGWSKEDAWSLNNHLARVIVGGIGQIRKNALGYPGELGSWEEWDAILAKIQAGFKLWVDTNGWFAGEPGEGEMYEQQFKEAMELFAHWFGGLWD